MDTHTHMESSTIYPTGHMWVSKGAAKVVVAVFEAFGTGPSGSEMARRKWLVSPGFSVNLVTSVASQDTQIHSS